MVLYKMAIKSSMHGVEGVVGKTSKIESHWVEADEV